VSHSVLLCHLRDLPEGAARGFDPRGEGRDTMFVVRRQGLHAYRDACPHWQGAPMAWRKDAYLSGDGERIVCHAHGAQFDIATGACVLGPCLGQSLTPVPLIQTDGGEIHVAVDTFQETSS
jgi:nitrite reductase/ring-hydroxylating ferredoxin subunit